jgi:hypothetical protein
MSAIYIDDNLYNGTMFIHEYVKNTSYTNIKWKHFIIEHIQQTNSCENYS